MSSGMITGSIFCECGSTAGSRLTGIVMGLGLIGATGLLGMGW